MSSASDKYQFYSNLNLHKLKKIQTTEYISIFVYFTTIVFLSGACPLLFLLLFFFFFFFIYPRYSIWKNLKIPKGQWEAVNRRRADNTMAKRRRAYNTMAKRRRAYNTMVKRRRTDNTMAKMKKTKEQNDLQSTRIT